MHKDMYTHTLTPLFFCLFHHDWLDSVFTLGKITVSGWLLAAKRSTFYALFTCNLSKVLAIIYSSLLWKFGRQDLLWFHFVFLLEVFIEDVRVDRNSLFLLAVTWTGTSTFLLLNLFGQIFLCTLCTTWCFSWFRVHLFCYLCKMQNEKLLIVKC